jgi:VWFA-related protein
MTAAGRRAIVVMLATVATGGAVLAAQTPTFRARLDIVQLDVLVTKGSKTVVGLTANDFEVTDNGMPQKIDLLSSDDLSIDAVIALDLSGSVTGQRLNELRSASRAFVDGLRTGDQAALVGFSHQLDLHAALTKDLKKVATSLATAAPSGGTSLFDASYAGLVMAESETGRSLALVFTDGSDTSSWLSADDVLDVARRVPVVVYAVAVPERIPPTTQVARNAAEWAYGVKVPSPDPRFLRDLSNLTGGSLVLVNSTSRLDETFRNIVLEFRQRYLLTYKPTNTPGDGWHEVKVNVKGAKGKGVVIKARAGYVAGR